MIEGLYYGLIGIGYLLVIIPTIVAWYNGVKLTKGDFTTQLFIPQTIGLILIFFGIMGSFSNNTDPLLWQVLTVLTASASALFSITSGVLSTTIIRWRSD